MSEVKMSEELKPCPFCGIEPMTFNQTGLIICAYSMCGVNPESKSKEDWNNRTTDRLQQENAELKELAMYCQGFLGCEEARDSMALHGITIKAKELIAKLNKND